MPKLDRYTVLFSLNTMGAALLAIFIALSIGLERPFWAMATAYIVSSPLSGAVRSKAVYRLTGTALGAAAAVVLVPNLVNSPSLLCLAIALWVAACLTVSLLDRTPRSYLMMLAGYTAVLIGFPSVGQPGTIFQVAVLRVEEIGLGILCASLVHSLVFPQPVGRVLIGRLEVWLQDADRWALDAMGATPAAAAARDRSRLAAAASEIHVLASHLPFDTSHLRDRRAGVRALHDRMLLLIPLLSGVEDRRRALEDAGGLPPQARALCAEAQAWLEGGASLPNGRALTARMRAFGGHGPARDWPGLLADSLMLRLADAVEALGDMHALLAYVRDPAAAEPARIRRAVAAASRRPLHADLSLALRSGGTAMVATLIACALWIGLGWREGVTAAMMAAVFSCMFASLEDPAPQIASFGLFSFLGIPFAALYLFAILPMTNGFVTLALALAPVLFVGGLYQARPQTTLNAQATLIIGLSALGLQQSFSADLESFVNANLAQFVGVFIALVTTRVLRSLSAEAVMRRLLAKTWRGLADLARTGAAPAPSAFAARLVDRLALLSPKLAGAAAAQDLVGEAALADLRTAMNLVAVQTAAPEVDGEARRRIDRVRLAVGEHFAALARTGRRPPAPALLEAVDAALAAVCGQTGTTARAACAGLVGLRRNLFPAAPAFRAAVEEALA